MEPIENISSAGRVDMPAGEWGCFELLVSDTPTAEASGPETGDSLRLTARAGPDHMWVDRAGAPNRVWRAE